MIKYILRYFAKRTHDIRYQLLIGTLYGCVELFGVRGTILIMMKARKMKPPSRRVVTIKPTTPTL